MTQGCELGRNRSVSLSVADQGLFLRSHGFLYTVQFRKKYHYTLYERHDGEEMREGANYFVFENGRHIDLFGA